MLVGLTIRDVVLIDRLSLRFAAGLTVLTGETGAGKSILLDALGLALGARSDSGLVRRGAETAVVSAEFFCRGDHPVHRLLREQGLESEETLVARRVVGADGRSRAFLNDQPVGVGLLRRIGEELVEVHGQFESYGLLDPRCHRGVLDAFGGAAVLNDQVAVAFRAWRRLEAAREAGGADAERARGEEDFLRHALAELEALAPGAAEEAVLAEQRTLLMHGEKLAEAIRAAHGELAGERGADRALASALRQLGRIADKAGGRLDGALNALEQAAAATAEAVAALSATGADLDQEPGALDRIEERLFALRAAARKHGVAVAALPDLQRQMGERLALIEDRGENLARLARQADQARAGYLEAAKRLSALRVDLAVRLDQAVAQELPPLKLDRARFETMVEPLAESEWGPFGIDRVSFRVATNPGAAPGPLGKIASGGELARFMLALRVVLAGSASVPTLVFDEVDAGIGGATAAAVGERLVRLGRDRQVLVVTHSPQVAARGGCHWQVRKSIQTDRPVTEVVPLSEAERREEIARMLSGARVTDEARAAADALMAP